VSSTK